MENPQACMRLKHQDREGQILETFKRNDEVFRNTMEGIFQKYSNLDDSGLDVCFETMTLRTRKGAVPIDSVEAEREIQNLRNHINAQHSLRVLDDAKDENLFSEQEDVTQKTENGLHTSRQTESRDLKSDDTQSCHLFVNSWSGSRSCLWEESSQPEEENEDLERTLNSHGSTLLDVYPSMLNQIGEVYHRQQMTTAASAVLRKYRHKRWRSTQLQRRSHVPSTSFNHTLNKTMESFTPQNDVGSHKTSVSNCHRAPLNKIKLERSPLKAIRNASLPSSRSNQEFSSLKSIRNSSLRSGRINEGFSPVKNFRSSSLAYHRSNQELSPLKNIRNSSMASSACFYSPRRAENSPVEETRLHWTDSCLGSVRVLDLSTQSSGSISRSPSPDLNQTYNIEPVTGPMSCGFHASAVFSPSKIMSNSPSKGAKNSLLIGQGCRSITGSPSRRCDSQMGQQFSNAFVGRECFNDRVYSPTLPPQQTLVGGSCSGGRSPLKRRVFSQELEQPSSIYYPRQKIHGHHETNSGVYRSPFRSQQGVYISPCKSPYPPHPQENLAMAEVHHPCPRPLKRQRSFSDSHSTSASTYRKSSQEIDAEFTRLYHHFICRGSSSSCPTSSCHLCERRLDSVVQSSPEISSNMSALALTPLRKRLQKRRRQSELEESLKVKRFRGSCSPKTHTYFWSKQHLQQQATKNTAVANPSEDKCTWNRALLLQCPSPRFLRSRRHLRRVSGSSSGLQFHPHAPSLRDASDNDFTEARSPVRTCKNSGRLIPPR
ncbi:uncharacterized protein si:dkeyp-117h8.4 isoform X2 [Hoplias malabaricus]|uniref:uncharacterized protein si:dkeyp-117h8.4 isoform X2 n=1 Tax=Hoplias malabaricus TaxID=27720 RepID=UPI0034628200